MTIGKRIAELRKQKRISQAELAKALNVSPSTIGMWETDQRAIKDEILSQIADFFGVTTDYLLGRNKTPSWAKEEDTIQLDKILKSNAGMFYGEDEATEEDREIIDDLVAGYFWSKKQKEKLNNKEG